MGGVIIDEVFGEPVDIFQTDGAAVQLQTAFEQPAGAGADHIARQMQRDRGQPLAVENIVEGIDQVGRRIHERARRDRKTIMRAVAHRRSLIDPGAIAQVGYRQLVLFPEKADKIGGLPIPISRDLSLGRRMALFLPSKRR